MRKQFLALVLLMGIMVFTTNFANAANRSSKNEFNRFVGTYISDKFLRPDPVTGLPVDRSLLITVHADGTITTYNSQAYSKPNGRTEFNGIQLTPSLGAWEACSRHTIKAVFLDYFSFAINDVIGPNPDNFQVETSWNDGEYDRFTSIIEFFNKVDGRYQEGTLTLTLKGIGHNDDPLNPDAPVTATYTVENIHLRRVNVLGAYFN